MKLDSLLNIWVNDLSMLSNSDRGRVYFERAKQIVVAALLSPSERTKAVFKTRFRRAYLIEKVGCQPSVTTQNPRVRQLLLETDRQIQMEVSQQAARTQPQSRVHIDEIRELRSRVEQQNAELANLRRLLLEAAQNKPELAPQRSNPLTRLINPSMGERRRHKGPMADQRSAMGRIIGTDLSCICKGQPWPGIPTLVWPEGIDEAASDWFRVLVVERGVAASSAHEYANILRPFLRFCRERSRIWRSVDDDFLIVWREHLRRRQRLSIERINTSLKIIFAFYQWAEEKKRLQFQVGIYLQDELPASLAAVSFPISATRSFSKGRQGRVYSSWTTPLTISGSKKGSRVRHTPTEYEIRKLHSVSVEREHGERNSLIFSWAEESGPRRSEILRISKLHMPSNDEMSSLVENDEPWVINIQRKGGEVKPLLVLPDLLIRTVDYIQYERRSVVDYCLRNIVGYREPEEVFISGVNGMPLHPDSLTAIGRQSFRQAGIEHANIHRLRARFAVRTVETLVESIFKDDTVIGSESSWVETILAKAAELMGHSHPDSLRPYLTYVLNRRIQTADATKAEKLASRLRQLRLHEGTLVRRLGQHQALHQVACDIRAGRNSEAASALTEIVEQLADR